MPKRIDPQDIVGKKFGRLTVEAYAGVKRKPDGKIRDHLYQCRCECGNTKIISRGHLIEGNTQSCGCLQREKAGRSNHRHVRIDTEDLIGKKFGKLTVEKYLGREPRGSGRLHHIYQCRCECGNICEAYRQTLLSGQKTSCGCAPRGNSVQMDVNDIVGKKFGKLTVLEYAGITGNKNGNNRHEYLCRCECGKEKLISRSNLLGGGVNSCGCSKTIDPQDLIGKRCGKLTVVEYLGRDEYDPRHPHMYRCKCDCGNECIERRENLRSEHVLSCGCRAKEIPHPWVKKTRIDPQDIVGTRVGRLTVMEYLGRPEGSTYRDHLYRCKCDCGNEVVVKRNPLTRGNTRSCGCLKLETAKKNILKRKPGKKKKKEPIPQGPLPYPDDIIGESEGRLTCIKRLYQRADRNWVYLVKCECGHEFELDRGNFLLGQFRCPKCHKSASYVPVSNRIDVYDIIGNRYGRLTVLEYAGQGQGWKHLYLCQCDCGNTKIIQRSNLIRGLSKSCGCLQKETALKAGKVSKENRAKKRKENFTYGSKSIQS